MRERSSSLDGYVVYLFGQADNIIASIGMISDWSWIETTLPLWTPDRMSGMKWHISMAVCGESTLTTSDQLERLGLTHAPCE